MKSVFNRKNSAESQRSFFISVLKILQSLYYRIIVISIFYFNCAKSFSL